MTEQQKVLQIEIHKIIDDLQNGLIHPLTAKNGLYESANKALTIPVVVSTCCDNRTQAEKDMKKMWDEGETFR